MKYPKIDPFSALIRYVNVTKLPLTGDPGAGALAFGPTLLWALRALFLLSPPA